jgi:DNA-binding MarR family transcriptional regulator
LFHDLCCASVCPAGRNILVFKRLRQENASARHLSVTETTTLSLLQLLQEHGSLLASELAQLANITPPSMSPVLQHLYLLALAYIERQASATDKRKQHIQLTPAGQNMVATARAERDAWLAAALETCLSAEERQQLAAAVPLLADFPEMTITDECQNGTEALAALAYDVVFLDVQMSELDGDPLTTVHTDAKGNAMGQALGPVQRIASGDLHPAGKAFIRVVVAPKAADSSPALMSE